MAMGNSLRSLLWGPGTGNENSLSFELFPMRNVWERDYVKGKALHDDGYIFKDLDIPDSDTLQPKEKDKVKG